MRGFMGGSLVVYGLLAALPASAQTDATGPATNADQIGDIVVTAQRRTESLQATPVAVTALTSDLLEERQVGNVLDVATQVPNLTIETVTGVGNAARVFLRGVGEDQAQFNADPAVGIYIDGVYYARTNGALFDFLDIERVEVLRGPQGSLYGRNTSGGAINIITRRPDDEFYGMAEVAYGRFDQLEGRATLSGPLSDGLAASFSILHKERDGISYSPVLGRDVNRRDVTSLRASIAYDPTSNLRTRLTYDHTWDDSDAAVPTSIFTGPAVDLFRTQSGTRPDARFRSDGVAFHADLDLGAVTIGSITGYRTLKQRGDLDNDGEARVISEFEFGAKQSQVSQELTANFEGEQLHGIVGAYFFDENNDYDALTLIGSRANTTLIRRPDFSVQYTRSYAIFGQAGYEITPALTLTLGGRFTWDRKRFANNQPSVPAVFTARRKWDDFSPKIALDYKVSDDVFVYASYAKGYKAGGFNRSNIRVVAETPYDEERVESYEIGAKTDLLDRRLRLNVTGFYNDYTDLQLSTFDPATGTTRRFNAAQAKTKGIEAEATARISSGFDLYGSLGYLDAEYDKFVDRVNGVLTDVSFRKLKGAPKWQYNTGFRFEQPVSNLGSIRLGGEVSHRSKVYNNVANTEAIATEARTLLNASAAFTTADERWTITLAGRNLTDKKYFTNGIFIAGLISAVYPADPLTWTLSARYKF